MGVIDVHTRIRAACAAAGDPNERLKPLAEAGDAYTQAMGCVDAAFLLGPAPSATERDILDAENEALFGWSQTAAKAVLFFPGIDLLERDAARSVRQWVERGVAGITIAPADQSIRPTDDRCTRVLEAAASCDVPVIVSNPGIASGAGVLAYADAAMFDEPMAQIRSLTLLLGELGQFATDAMLTMLARHERLYADTSWLVDRPGSLWQVLSAAHERSVLSKILFGSGSPRVSPQRAIAGIYSMQAWASRTMGQALPREAIREVVERDALSELRIAADQASARSNASSDATSDVVVPRRARRALPIRGWE